MADAGAPRHYACRVQDFTHWRSTARALLAAAVPPSQVHWTDGTRAEASLFDDADIAPPVPGAQPAPRVPAGLLDMLQLTACHDARERWALMYRVLWRWTQGDRACLAAGDVDGTRLQQMIKSVRREVHHLHAFVRFREQPATADGARFVAWFEPAYPVLHMAAPYFANRMGKLSWLIATPMQTVASDGVSLALGPGIPKPAGLEDSTDLPEALWTTYYRNTFNPARLNIELMRGHMPVRLWKNLPEAARIDELIGAAELGGSRVAQSPEVAQRAGKRLPAPRDDGRGT